MWTVQYLFIYFFTFIYFSVILNWMKYLSMCSFDVLQLHQLNSIMTEENV